MGTTLASRRVVFGGTEETGPLRIAAGWVSFDAPSELSPGTIVAVGEGEPDPASDAVDLGERLIAPAFVNAHTHLALVALRGFDLDASEGNVVEDLFYRFETLLSAADVAAFARMGAYESLLAGVGLVWDHYFFGEALARGISDVGLCAVVAPTVQDLSGPGVPRWESELEATDAIASDGALAARGIFAACGPHATDTVSAEAWGKVAVLAEHLHLPVHAHLAQSPEEVARASEKYEETPTGWLQRIGVLDRARCVFAHALYVDRAELRALAERHTLVACPYSQLVFGFPARLDVWSDEKVRWTLATDAAASNDSMGLRKELRFAAGQRTIGASWSPAYSRYLDGEGDADSVWRKRKKLHARFAEDARPARLLERVWGLSGSLHPAFRAGVLTPGALANVVVYDTDHPTFWPGDDAFAALAFADVDAAIHSMWVNGRAIGEAGDFARSLTSSDDYAECRREATERLRALTRRLT